MPTPKYIDKQTVILNDNYSHSLQLARRFQGESELLRRNSPEFNTKEQSMVMDGACRTLLGRAVHEE